MATLRIVEPLASFLIDIAAKGTVLLVLAFFVTWLLRRSSAAMRHAVWSLTMLSLVLLPVAWWALPSLTIPILPSIESPVSSVESDTVANQALIPPATVEPRSVPPGPAQPGPAVSSVTVASSDGQREIFHDSRPEPATAPPIQPVDRVSEAQLPAAGKPKGRTAELSSRLISVVWVSGVVLFAAVLVLCVLKAVVLRRRSEVVTTGVWYRLLAELSQRLQIRRPVELREHAEPVVPLTWGVFRSVVLIPESAREWVEPMKRTVLLHELAHVRRGDVGCQLLGRIACTLFWFHPLAWYGLRRLRQEGEQACDDAVVRSGERASDYADQLLQVAQFCCEPRGLSLGVAMAEGNSLEVRVKSLFDTTRSHEPVRKTVSLMMLLVCGIMLAAVSAVRPVASTVVAAESSSGSALTSSAGNADSPRPERVPTGLSPEATEKHVTEEMRPVTSRELTGIWQGVTKDFGVLIQFIGRESRQPGKKGILSGRWTVHVYRASIGSALDFNDNQETGVVDIEFTGFDTRTGQSFRASIGRIERGLSGQLYLTVLKSKNQPMYPSIRRLPLTCVSNDQEIGRKHVDQLRAAEDAFMKGKPANFASSVAEPSEPAPKATATIVRLKNVIWWKKVDGLQAGFLLDSPAIPNQRVPYNSVAKYRILVRNTTDKDIRFLARLLPHAGVDAPYLISSDDITNSLAALQLPEKFRAQGIERQFKRSDPAYGVTLAPGEAVFIPGQSGLDELSLYVGEVEKRTHPTVAKIRPGMNWIVQPIQIQTFPSLAESVKRTSLLGRYKITRINSNGVARQESASRMVAVPGGKTLYPRIQLDVGTLTADAVRNARDAIWGKVDKELQCGIRMINPKRSYVVGDTLEAELLWRNTSDAAIWTPIPEKLDLCPIVHNEDDDFLPIDFGARFMIYSVSQELKSGEVRSLGIFRIKLVEANTPSPRSNAEPAHLTLASGTYRLSGSGGVSSRNGGSPTSAQIDFKVIRR
jgi:beta-lactamase regulating signal transducer with metallopeptidase domain